MSRTSSSTVLVALKSILPLSSILTALMDFGFQCSTGIFQCDFDYGDFLLRRLDPNHPKYFIVSDVIRNRYILSPWRTVALFSRLVLFRLAKWLKIVTGLRPVESVCGSYWQVFHLNRLGWINLSNGALKYTHFLSLKIVDEKVLNHGDSIDRSSHQTIIISSGLCLGRWLLKHLVEDLDKFIRSRCLYDCMKVVVSFGELHSGPSIVLSN